MNSHWQATIRSLLVGGLLGFVLLLPVVASAQPNSVRAASVSLHGDLALIETELDGLERRVNGLRSEVSAGSLTRSPKVISERFIEAKYAYLVEDYDRCALLLYSLIENRDLSMDPRRTEAEWYLAECLFQDGNLSVARKQFQKVVDAGGIHPFYGDALLKLIEIFGRTGDTARFNEYYNRFVRSSLDSSATALRIRYEMGKSLYRQGKLRDAMAIFGGFPRGSTYTPQARYFSGIIIVAEGNEALEVDDQEAAFQAFQRAIVIFREVLTLPNSTEAHDKVRDLAILNIARLLYEMGDIPSALKEYGRLSSESEFYADALYELIWANIEAGAQLSVRDESGRLPEGAEFERARKFDEALRAIEIFTLAFPEDARRPTLRLLDGHVRVRMELFDEAVVKYKESAEHFRGLKELVGQVVTSGADPMVYFNQLVGDEYAVEAALTIPVVARRQARSDDRVERAVEISRDLYDQQSDISSSSELLGLLEEALYQQDSAGLIQTYRINRQQLASAEAAGLLLRARLVEVETAFLEAVLSGNQRNELDVAGAAIGDASDAASSLSSKRQETLQRQQVMNLQAQAVETRVYHVELAVKDLLGRLSALEKYLVDARQRGESGREAELAARRAVEEERAVLGQLQDELRGLKNRLEPRVLTGAMAGLVVSDESGEREAARGGLSSAEVQLARLRRSVSGGDEFFRRIDNDRRRLVDLEGLARQTRDLMDRAEAAEVDDIKAEVTFQRDEVSGLVKDSEVLGEENEQVSGRIGEQAFVDVADFYEDMLTRADMGVADVYWYRKESSAKARVQLSREKVRRLRALQDAFEEVLSR